MKTVMVAAALIIEQEKILVTQRKKDSSHGLLWEFPGGKVKEGEDEHTENGKESLLKVILGGLCVLCGETIFLCLYLSEK